MIRETDLDEAEKRGKAEGIELGRELASDEMMLIIVDIKKMDLIIEQIAEKYNTSQERVFRLKSLIF
jgi:hypothetical protein